MNLHVPITSLKGKIVGKIIAGFVLSTASGICAIVINETTGFSLGVIFAVFSGVWWLGRKLQNLEDRMNTAQEWRVETSKRMDDADEERRSILKTLASLPCMTVSCPENENKT